MIFYFVIVRIIRIVSYQRHRNHQDHQGYQDYQDRQNCQNRQNNATAVIFNIQYKVQQLSVSLCLAIQLYVLSLVFIFIYEKLIPVILDNEKYEQKVEMEM